LDLALRLSYLMKQILGVADAMIEAIFRVCKTR
jgi:hypothetical protein